MRLKISDKHSGELVLPVFMEDNYITLFPGERRQIEIDLSHLGKEINVSEPAPGSCSVERGNS